MLFQPTNITPSQRGELGNGTIDATEDLTVTWQVNGNSAMTAFEIKIFANNTESTLLYETGELTDNCPFYGVNAAGETVFFAYTVPASALSTAGITNGNSYKLEIVQWWSDSDSVEQSSAAAFITRGAPSLTLAAIPDTIDTKTYTFTAAYTQAQNDALNWVRWRLAYSDDAGNPFYDTGNIYGTALLQMSYDGLFRNTSYVLSCEIQTENGVEASATKEFNVQYDVSPLSGVVTAEKACGKSAIRVTWPKLSYIPGIADGTYTANGELVLGPNASVIWNSVNGSGMNFGLPWYAVLRGRMASAGSINLWETKTDEEERQLLAVDMSGGQIDFISFNGEDMETIENIPTGAELMFVVFPTLDTRNEPTPRMITVVGKAAIPTGGLYPSETLYPSEALYPAADTSYETRTFKKFLHPWDSTVINNWDLSLSEIEIINNSSSDNMIWSLIQIRSGTPTEEEIAAILASGQGYAPEYDADTLFLADFSNGLGAGNLGADSGAQVTGIAIYRKQGDGGVLRHLADAPIGSGTEGIYDYGAASQQGPYAYDIFPISTDTYSSAPIVSNGINPCFWEWVVLECQKYSADYGTATNGFVVLREYRFDKNLSSGAVSNNNTPNILKNFTAYPTVQLSPANYKSGTLTSLIGVIDAYTADYSDSIALRDAIYELSVTTNPLFLKNRKGDLMQIRIAGDINMETMDNTREQAQTVTLPWVEIADATDAVLVQFP